jgi:hypothetical protein
MCQLEQGARAVPGQQAFLHDGIDDIAPLTGLGARNTNLIFSSSFEDGEG